MNDSLPPKMLFDLSVNSGNYTLNQLQLQQHIAKQEVTDCSKRLSAEYSPFRKTDLVFAWHSE